jgi:Ni,Fe-hydrogenase I large subunit
MNKLELIEKIEGEATLDFHLKNKEIEFVDIKFLHSRHIENILKGKNPLDALVINPRVCGICGHAHLIATVQALENCYEKITISPKAQILRELTLNFELIQNHFKWFYLVILPLFGHKQNIYKATHPSKLMGKAIATIAGQYPHNSYAIPGGITNEVLPNEILSLERYIDETLQFYKNHMINVNLEKFIDCESVSKVFSRDGDLVDVLSYIKKEKLSKIGKSYDRFLVFGENGYFKSGRAVATRLNHKINTKYINEFTNKDSYAKNVKYKKYYYEVGPLARAMVNKTPLIKDSHRRYQDSIISRILARICEIPQLLFHSKHLLTQLYLDEPSYIKPLQEISELSSTGTSAIEAARGSLIHSVSIDQNKIQNYQIITPTQWNLSNGTIEDPGVSQKAMMGIKDIELAKKVFKTFDVCSVCTTH